MRTANNNDKNITVQKTYWIVLSPHRHVRQDYAILAVTVNKSDRC